MEEYNNVQRLGESRNDIYWILYQTVNLQNNKIYIGVHKTKNPYEFDGYIGCGVYITQPNSYIYSKTKFQAAVKKYGVHSFKRTVIKIFTNEEDAYLEEGRIVNDDFLARSDVYNMIKGGKIPEYMYKTVEIHQYSLEGKYIKTFKSIEEAAKEINRNPSSISEANTCKFTCGDYYWSTIKQDFLDLSKYKKKLACKEIHKYSAETGEYLETYSSTRSTGYSQASQSAILGNLVDGKYYFCYIKDSTYDKARDSYIKSRKIYQYDSDGNFLKEWNYLEALKQFPKDGINQAIRHKKLTNSGYYWGLQQYEIYNKPIKKQEKRIGKFTMDGDLIKIYKNSAECYKENGKGTYKVFSGLRNSYKGFKYQYIE